MRKRIAMVLLGLSLAVGTPAATNMFPTVSAQTVQAAGKTGWTQESGTWYFYKDGVKQTGWQTWDGKKYYLNADGTMKANEWMIDTDGSGLLLPQLGWCLPELQGKNQRQKLYIRCRQ